MSETSAFSVPVATGTFARSSRGARWLADIARASVLLPTAAGASTKIISAANRRASYPVVAARMGATKGSGASVIINFDFASGLTAPTASAPMRSSNGMSFSLIWCSLIGSLNAEWRCAGGRLASNHISRDARRATRTFRWPAVTDLAGLPTTPLTRRTCMCEAVSTLRRFGSATANAARDVESTSAMPRCPLPAS